VLALGVPNFLLYILFAGLETYSFKVASLVSMLFVKYLFWVSDVIITIPFLLVPMDFYSTDVIANTALLLG